MSQRPSPGVRSSVAFRIVAGAALLAAVGQITLGGVVRVTESGLGCPDWPLCHGRLVPPLEFHTLIEYTHRLSASVLGVLVLAAAAIAWWAYRKYGGTTIWATIALILVVAAAALGAVSVLTELDRWVVSFHLAIAELVVASLVVALVAGWRTAPAPVGPSARPDQRPRRPGPLGFLVVSCVLGTLVLILLGSYVVGLGYGSVCGTWPLCQGSLLPDGQAFRMHMSHRYLVVIVGTLIAWTAASAWSRRAERPDLARASIAMATLYLIQAAIGAATVWSGFAMAFRALHLGVATVLWVSVVLLVSLSSGLGRLQLPVVEARASGSSSLEGVAT